MRGRRGRQWKKCALFEASRLEKVNRTASATTKSTDDERARLATELGLDSAHLTLDVVDQLGLVRVRLDLAQAVLLSLAADLLGKRKCADSRSGKASVVTERSNAAAVFFLQEFKVVEHAGRLSGLPARNDVDPATLLLVAVSEHDVGVGKGRGVVRGQLLEANDGGSEGSGRPRVVLGKGAADAVDAPNQYRKFQEGA